MCRKSRQSSALRPSESAVYLRKCRQASLLIAGFGLQLQLGLFSRTSGRVCVQTRSPSKMMMGLGCTFLAIGARHQAPPIRAGESQPSQTVQG